MARTFVGIGFGPIQCGLFLLEAVASRNFDRLVVAEVVPEVVAAVRRSQGRIRVNVAHASRLSTVELTGIEIYNPREPSDAARLVDAIAAADEIATGLPSVDFYPGGEASPAALLARGFERKLADTRLPRAIVYAAENHTNAAQRLEHDVLAAGHLARSRLADRVAFLDTVIGKMSGVVHDSADIERSGLAPLVEGVPHAVLVEEFNHILISRVPLIDFPRGIAAFQEKSDLLPFEEAKLNGHNAAHALFGYLAHWKGLTLMCESDPALCQFVAGAFLKESGGALCRRHAGVDALFTAEGWQCYVDDLMKRMINPYLRDRVERVIRDPRRKLAWNDRLVGVMRLALAQGIEPRCFAVGASLAARHLADHSPAATLQTVLSQLWQEEEVSCQERDAVTHAILNADLSLVASALPA